MTIEAGQAFALIGDAITQAYLWFHDLLFYSSLTGVYLAVFFIMLVARYLLAPLFGSAIFAGASDTVRSVKERNRYHGAREKNSRGKFSKG